MSESVESKLNNGVLLTLGRDDAKSVFAAREDELLKATLVSILSTIESQCLADCQSQWPTLHRMFTGGSLEPDAGELPLNQCILGGRPLYQGPELTVVVVRPDMVPHIFDALKQLAVPDLEVRLAQAQAATDDRLVQAAEIESIAKIVDSVRDVYEFAASHRQAVVFCARHAD